MPPFPVGGHIWKRYIDDIFLIWNGNRDELNQFITNINKVHPTIKFTHEVDTNELTFLDTIVYKGPDFHTTNKLDVKTHIKPTNNYTYINRRTTQDVSKKLSQSAKHKGT